MLKRAVYKLKNSQDVHWRALRVTGPDALDFLHRITTVDVKGMQLGETREGLILSPQGKIQAYFFMTRTAGTEFFLEFDAGADGFWEKSLVERLNYFLFSEKLEIQPVTGDCMWVIEDPASEGHKLPEAKLGTPWMSVWNQAVSGGEISWNELDQLSIEQGTPWWSKEIQKDSNPLELNLRSAIADQKGCYPGQEVIEKIIAIGSPAKRLCLVMGEDGVQSLKVVSKVNAVVGGAVLKVFSQSP